MPQWQNDPPPVDKAVPYRIVRVPPAKPLTGIVTCTEIVGCNTHYLRNRTVPCEGPDQCDACAEGHAWRWHAYVSLLLAWSYEHVILELTAAASDPLRNYARNRGSLRGCQLNAHRPSKRPNGRIVVTCKVIDNQHVTLPDPPNIQRILCHVWGVQYKRPELKSILKPPAVQMHVDPSDDDARYRA